MLNSSSHMLVISHNEIVYAPKQRWTPFQPSKQAQIYSSVAVAGKWHFLEQTGHRWKFRQPLFFVTNKWPVGVLQVPFFSNLSSVLPLNEWMITLFKHDFLFGFGCRNDVVFRTQIGMDIGGTMRLSFWSEWLLFRVSIIIIWYINYNNILLCWWKKCNPTSELIRVKAHCNIRRANIAGDIVYLSEDCEIRLETSNKKFLS